MTEPHTAFGSDRFGQIAERIARFFGTPGYIIGQTAIVIVWIAVNVLVVALRFDPYPFILLNLAFSTQAAYAAPLILLAQTRQADRDKLLADRQQLHAERLAADHADALQTNTRLTEQIRDLTIQVRALLDRDDGR